MMMHHLPSSHPIVRDGFALSAQLRSFPKEVSEERLVTQVQTFLTGERRYAFDEYRKLVDYEYIIGCHDDDNWIKYRLMWHQNSYTSESYWDVAVVSCIPRRERRARPNRFSTGPADE